MFEVFIEKIILAHFVQRMNGKDVSTLANKRAEFPQLPFIHPEVILRWAVSSLKGDLAMRAGLFRTPEHIVDEGAIDIGAAEADGLEEEFVIGDKIAVVHQFVGQDVFMAGVAEHHQSPRDRHGFSSGT